MPGRKLLFVDRDGTLIVEPADQQVDRLDKLALMPDVIPALLQLQEAGYELIMVSNQDGLGTDAFPREDFERVQKAMLDIFASQGIRFAGIHIDPHFEHQQAFTRKPQIGMVLDYLKSGDLDPDRSFVIGDRQTDLELAANMGIGGFLVGGENDAWAGIAHRLCNLPRQARVHRKTRETDIRVRVDLDAPGPLDIGTGLGFFDHMLEQLASHGGFSLQLCCEGDLHIDDHHTVEDCALALGEALREALGDKRGIGRYGFVLPMDESRAEVAVDLSGRPHFRFDGDLPRVSLNGLTTEMVKHFFASLSQGLAMALHMTISGDNSHHMVEALFKGCGRALRPALERRGRDLPSTKGRL